MEGSGLDFIAIESVVYSAAALRGTCAGKQYTRGEEFHIMNSLAILSLKQEETLVTEIPENLKTKAKSFRAALHDDNSDAL